MKVLNLYAGLGGNRRLWSDCEVTAVELNERIAGVYRELFPCDEVVVGDAHKFLLDHYQEYEFIWSSPPCPSHSRARYWRRSTLAEQSYPNMKLYQEIIFLQNFIQGGAKFCVENVEPYYEPLIHPTKQIGRHLLWTNFKLGLFETQAGKITVGKSSDWVELHNVDLGKYKLNKRKDQLYRNMVEADLGLYIFDRARNIVTRQDTKQLALYV